MTEELGTEIETQGKILDRRKRYRKKPTTKTPLSVYFNMDVPEDVEALEALEYLKDIYGGEKQGKSVAVKEVIRIFYKQLQEKTEYINKLMNLEKYYFDVWSAYQDRQVEYTKSRYATENALIQDEHNIQKEFIFG